jgi:glutathione reductase (NADPH)
MATRHFDVVIIGGGNAGMGVTTAATKAGLSVALLEPSLLGGTCSNRGCTPKKVLVAAAHALDEIEKAGAHKIKVGKAKLDWAAMIDREKELIRELPERFRTSLADLGVTIIKGDGRFVGPNAVMVNGDILEAKHIVVATGSKPRQLPIPGAELMVTSDDVLSNRKQPRDVVFVGGGVIAFEFAHVYARAGTKVTILEVAPGFLANFDQDAVGQVLHESQRIGIEARHSVSIERIEKAGRRRRVVFKADGAEQAVETDLVVNGAGRIAALDGLDLEAGGVAVERGRITTDNHMRSTSNPAAWAGGDALAGKQQLSPVATHEGEIIGDNIAGGSRPKPDYAMIPSCLYTVPTLATVGLTEAAARQTGRKIRVAVNDMTGWLSGRTFAETAAWAKVIIDEETDLIRGAHIVGHGGEELIHLFAFAMRHAVTVADMKRTVYAYPTYTADVKAML